MAEIATYRKNKIELSEYDYADDILSRVLMSQFTPRDVEVLEEILYSSLKIPVSVLSQNVSLAEKDLLPILEKLEPTKLFKIENDHVVVDKEKRKYFELQILKFEEDFKPGMEYLQGLLKKVPIHVLPTWYSISRTSNNIFESIVEKYLYTPQIFQRYLMDLSFTDPIQQGIMNALLQSPHYEIFAADMMEKYKLTREQFEEHMLHLEFNFVCCIKFIKKGNRYEEVITPFYEWGEYLRHIKDCEPSPILDEEKIVRVKQNDFGIMEEMSAIVSLASKGALEAGEALNKQIQKLCPDFDEEDFSYYVEKLTDLNLLAYEGEKIVSTSDSSPWLTLPIQEKALYCYRHPLNSLQRDGIPENLCTQRTVREAEKSISYIVNSGWVDLEEFLGAIYIPLNEEQHIYLNRVGRNWKYQFPEYSEDEQNFFRAVIQDWLFEMGIVALGTKEGRDCFCVTPLGKELYGND